MSEIHDKVKPLVSWLNTKGFETTDSGDGVTNVEAGMEGALPFAHVIVKINPAEDDLISSADWIHRNLPFPFTNWHVEASYSPNDGFYIIMISEQ